MTNHIEQASVVDAAQIAVIVNQAYRPNGEKQGWTHEAKLVAGMRTTTEKIIELFKSNSTVLVMRREAQLVACIHIEHLNKACYVGMLATNLDFQNQGIGKEMLAAAEVFAQSTYSASELRMFILSSRPELLSYYNRRGYVATGNIIPYPVHAGVGTPMQNDLHALELQKHLSEA